MAMLAICVPNVAMRAAVDIVSTVALIALTAESPTAAPAEMRPRTMKTAE